LVPSLNVSGTTRINGTTTLNNTTTCISSLNLSSLNVSGTLNNTTNMNGVGHIHVGTQFAAINNYVQKEV
jgi:hypothetical protein